MEDRARILEERVEDLTLEIAEAINQAEVPGRPAIRAELTELAITVLRGAVTIPEPVIEQPAVEGSSRSSPIAMGIPLFGAGAVLIFIFPPVGMVLFVAAIAMVGWGLVDALIGRR